MYPFVLLAVILLLSSVPGSAQISQHQRDQQQQETLTISTGIPGGTYQRFFDEMSRSCSGQTDVPILSSKPSSGSGENIDNLVTNQANLAFVQADALWARQLIDNDERVNDVKTLMVLYPEEVHLLTRSQNINQFSDLVGRRVRAWGGSFLTGKVVFWKTGIIPSQFYDTKSKDAAVAQLDKGDADAILAVGGQPLDWIKQLPQGWKLVPFNVVERVRPAGYDVATLQYQNLTPTGIKSITTQSLLVTMNYKSKSKVVALRQLRKCIVDNLDELRETTGNHPKWRLVSSDNKTIWPMYDPLAKMTPVLPQRTK